MNLKLKLFLIYQVIMATFCFFLDEAWNRVFIGIMDLFFSVIILYLYFFDRVLFSWIEKEEEII